MVLYSSTNKLRIEFYANGWTNRPGFLASWSQVSKETEETQGIAIACSISLLHFQISPIYISFCHLYLYSWNEICQIWLVMNYNASEAYRFSQWKMIIKWQKSYQNGDIWKKDREDATSYNNTMI